MKVAILGLGEAGSHFANDLSRLGVGVWGYDPRPLRKLSREVQLMESNSAAVEKADLILSVNLSSVSEEVAAEVSSFLRPDQFYLEMNTSSPEKKKSIATIVKASGVKYIDLAIMAPVPPTGILTPFLAAGEHSLELLEFLRPLGLNLSIVEDGKIGDAACRKLLRSIVYKGIAAIVCEAVAAGDIFEMPAYMRKQITSLIGGNEELIDRFVEGSKTHAERRMHEMKAVIEMLEEKGLQPIMTPATHDMLKSMI